MQPFTEDVSSAGAVTAVDLDGVTGVRLLVPDMHGVPRSKTVLPEMFERMVTEGHTWPAPLLAADLWQNINDASMEALGTGNIEIRPVLDTFGRLPWNPGVAVVMCEAFYPDGRPAPTPRAALTRVIGELSGAGFELKIGAELEFFVYDQTPDGPPPFGMREWFTSQAMAKVAPFTEDLQRFLPAMDLPLYEVFNEHAAGQMEINLRPANGVAALDKFLVLKLALKELGARNGLHVTTMCKPRNDAECATSGLHIHQVLERGGDNAFAAADGKEGLSDLAKHYIAGQLEHAGAITAFAAQTINAYKRYRPDTWAPTRKAWGMDNRTAMLRGILAGDNTRIENRLGASDANGYLLVAAQAAAGLDGVRRELTPPQPASHDVIKDETYDAVPTNLLDSLRALEQDDILRDQLGTEFCEHFLGMQYQIWERYQGHVSDWELKEYTGVL